MEDTIALKRKKLELSRVALAREELEFKIEERKEEITRMQAMIDIQLTKEQDLLKEIEQLSQK